MPSTAWTSPTGPTHWIGNERNQGKLGVTEEGEGAEEVKDSELGQGREQQLLHDTEEDDPVLEAQRFDSRELLIRSALHHSGIQVTGDELDRFLHNFHARCSQHDPELLGLPLYELEGTEEEGTEANAELVPTASAGPPASAPLTATLSPCLLYTSPSPRD